MVWKCEKDELDEKNPNKTGNIIYSNSDPNIPILSIEIKRQLYSFLSSNNTISSVFATFLDIHIKGERGEFWDFFKDSEMRSVLVLSYGHKFIAQTDYKSYNIKALNDIRVPSGLFNDRQILHLFSCLHYTCGIPKEYIEKIKLFLLPRILSNTEKQFYLTLEEGVSFENYQNLLSTALELHQAFKNPVDKNNRSCDFLYSLALACFKNDLTKEGFESFKMIKESNGYYDLADDALFNLELWEPLFQLINKKLDIPFGRPPLFKLEKNQKISYLFGALHIAKLDTVIPFIQNIIENSNTFVTEPYYTDIQFQQKFSIELLLDFLKKNMCFNKDGEDNGFNFLSFKQKERFRELLSALFFQFTTYPDPEKLNFISAYLFILSALQKNGMDDELSKKYQAQSKKILGLDKKEFNTFQPLAIDTSKFENESDPDLSSHISEELKKLDLIASLYTSEKFLSDSKLLEISKSGKKIFEDRNKEWLPKINQYHLNELNPFIAVGALHLVGPTGLLQLLENEGFTIKMVNENDLLNPYQSTNDILKLPLIYSQINAPDPSEILSKRDVINFDELRDILTKLKTLKDGTLLPSPELALRRAAATGKIEYIKRLIAVVKDIDVNEAGPGSGSTALDFAELNGHLEIVSYLKNYGAKSGSVSKHKVENFLSK